MTTYLLLALHDDGYSQVYELGDAQFKLGIAYDRQREPVARGFDRGQFRTYAVANFLIDVMALPKAANQKASKM